MANEIPQGPQVPPQAPQQMPQQPQAPQQPYGPQPGFTPVRKPGTPSLSFPQALQRFFANLFNFNGRDRKSAYWWPVLCVGGAWFLMWIIMWASLGRSIEYAFYAGSFKIFYILEKLISAAACVLLLGATIRRFQDSGKSNILAWLTAGTGVAESLFCLLFALTGSVAMWTISWIFWVPWLVLLIITIVFTNLEGTPGPNQYGPSEKYPA